MGNLKNSKISFFFVIALSLSTFISSATCEDGYTEEADKVFDSVNSPFCSGRLLRDCPSTASSDLKKEVIKRVKSGENSEAIIADLYSQYGDKIRAEPDDSFVGMLAWLIPIAVLILGAGTLAFVVKGNTKKE